MGKIISEIQGVFENTTGRLRSIMSTSPGGAPTDIAGLVTNPGGGTTLVDALGNSINLNSPVGTTVTATGALPDTALGVITPYNSASAGVLSLPDAATAWAASPYSLVVVSQKGAGAASFTASGSDNLRATSGVSASSVQYGMIAAQIISATEWALA